MESFLIWLEERRVSVAIAESALLYPTILAAHGVGMAVVVGLNWVVSLRVLGMGTALPLASMTRFSPIMWMGFGVNAITGFLLTIAGATRVLVDPVFFFKIAFVVLAVINLRSLNHELLLNHGRQGNGMARAPESSLTNQISKPKRKLRRMAVASIFLWVGAITLGRLMAYTFFRFWQ